VRWNENRAAAAVEGREQPLLSYSGHLQHSLNQLSQLVLGVSLVEDYTAPREYTGERAARLSLSFLLLGLLLTSRFHVTGELLGVEYLYSQTGTVLQDASVAPDVPDDEAAFQDIDTEDEGFEEAGEDVDPTVVHVDLTPPRPHTASSSGATAASGSGYPAGAPGSGPSTSSSVPSAPPDHGN